MVPSLKLDNQPLDFGRWRRTAIAPVVTQSRFYFLPQRLRSRGIESVPQRALQYLLRIPGSARRQQRFRVGNRELSVARLDRQRRLLVGQSGGLLPDLAGDHPEVMVGLRVTWLCLQNRAV